MLSSTKSCCQRLNEMQITVNDKVKRVTKEQFSMVFLNGIQIIS